MRRVLLKCEMPIQPLNRLCNIFQFNKIKPSEFSKQSSRYIYLYLQCGNLWLDCAFAQYRDIGRVSGFVLLEACDIRAKNSHNQEYLHIELTKPTNRFSPYPTAAPCLDMYQRIHPLMRSSYTRAPHSLIKSLSMYGFDAFSVFISLTPRV